MHNANVFPDPNKFKPKRFLESNGQYVSSRPNWFIPFGMERINPKEKLAFADLFLIVVNLLQKTSDYEFALPDGPGSANLIPETKTIDTCYPYQYKFFLKLI